ncbi:MAG: T9SS type A sorting domain-containing protein [Balneolaceae bacterium]|nr:T9SS type A sorting domain-containing protein [Balneolaceae bacterium]
MLFLFLSPSSHSQEIQLKRSHPISLNKEVRRSTPAIGTLNVVAVMVEFQPDTNRLTSGTGVFGENGFDGLPYLTREEKTYIDPLPHNQTYFENHLEFAKNYFLKSSDQQLTIEYQVLPQVYQLDKMMEEYAPIGETFTLEKIALLMQDVWTKVDEQGGFDASGLDPENTAFVIFHAGIGRDVELLGTSLDITPFDLPSITLDEESLGDLLDDPTFDGFSINNGSFRVNNSMLIPRTQSRRGTNISDNEIVFPLSINGLLCASIGSYLGLPDLFNTENGQPAIGRFGLMDGAGFFAYNGLLPPEPSAWEKIFLGWETPFEVSVGETDAIELPAASLNLPNSIAKISLSSTEYFLIENRHRDPELLGETDAEVVISTYSNFEIRERAYSNFDEDFIFQAAGFDTLLIPGTIVDVSNFDWSLPGGLDVGEDGDEGTEDDRHLNGGILIWHIDEGVLAQQLARDRVNANENRRGVDLEEGDGAQDIGKSVGLLENSPTFGYAFDFWWAGNDFRVITPTSEIDLNPDNIFGPESYPNNNSNSGARSGFELYDFSDNLPVASFKIREVNSLDQNIESILSINGIDYYTFNPSFWYWDLYPLTLEIFKNEKLIIPSFNFTYILDLSNKTTIDTLFIANTTRPIVDDEAIYLPFFTTYVDPLASSVIPFSLLRIIKYTLAGDNSLTFEWTTNSIPLRKGQDGVSFTDFKFLSSNDNGSTIELDFIDYSIDPINGDSISSPSDYEFRSEIINNKFVGINGNAIEFVGENIPDYLADYEYRLFAGTIESNLRNYYYLFEDGRFSLVDPSKSEPIIQIFDEAKAEWPAIVDEGHIYRINRTDNQIEGYNFNGALLANTPILAPDSIQFLGTPIITDITGDNRQDMLVVGQDEYSVNIFAYETDGNPIEGFPLYVGGAVGKDVQPIHPVMYNDVLYAVSHTGDLRAWRFLNHTTTQWPGRYGENPYNKVSAYIEFEETSGSDFSVLNKSETYNWPNPANEETNIRFELASAGTVDITIIDYSGRVVFERTVQAFGGAPEEITVNTSAWASGAYFGRIEANVNGKKESKTIKIGVVH